MMQIWLLLATASLVVGDELDITIIQTTEGQIAGRVVSVGGQIFLAFRGIPYARPPVGVLRFLPPEPPVPWPGVRTAKFEGNACPQLLLTTDIFAGNEDCLYLNVYTYTDAKGVPVVMWIHSGGFHSGDGSLEVSAPDYLMEVGHILVTLNHRLGPLGFLSTGDNVIQGNFGLKDIIMALKWVKRNIATFGGDPESVTVGGMGSGAALAQYLMLVPSAKGLFHRVITQSGSVLNPWALQRTPFENAQEVARLMNCPLMSTSTELRDCLVAVPAERLVRTLYHFPHWGTRFPIPWAPVIESDFIPDSPEWLLRYGHITPVPLLAGNFFTEHMLLASYIYKHDELRAEFVNNFEETSKKAFHLHHIPNDILSSVKDFYAQGKPFKDISLVQLTHLMSDAAYTHGVNRAARLVMESSPMPVYFYLTVRDEPVDVGNLDELPSVIAAKRFSNLLSNFATSGNPTPARTDLFPQFWQPITKAKPMVYFSMTDTVVMKSDPDFEKRMAYWDDIMYKLTQESSKKPKTEL